MAAHATTTSAPVPHPVRVLRPHPRPRLVLAFVLVLVLAVVALAPRQVADLAHAACTIGNPDHVTCGEALVLLGYP